MDRRAVANFSIANRHGFTRTISLGGGGLKLGHFSSQIVPFAFRRFARIVRAGNGDAERRAVI
jgi:hypothetical protein